MTFTQRVFSGIKPSGDLHLGNYLGAIRRFVPLQDTHETLYCVVDMHAITVWQDPVDLKRWTYEIAAAYIAAGLDPRKSIIFNQSQVVEHAELGWIFNCVARVGWMSRMTQFKDKAGGEGGENSEQVSLGLYAYPSLMAADILLYKATAVPVGDDQKQHLELTRDIAKKFNHDYKKQIKALGGKGDFFPVPETLATGPAMRVKSLKDGSKKMSKSDASDMSTIYMMDDADLIAKKIKRATTDADALPSEAAGLAGRAEAENLVGIYASLSNRSVDDVLGEFGGQGWGVFKPALADLSVAVLAPIADEMKRLVSDRGEMDNILRDGAARARTIAEPVMAGVRDIVGFVR
ncbi:MULTISPECIES: tryptophan--tRNA ligase [Devosia]|uniref:Tryptophan--tRNA ligase n=1 Tax=Devosia equisanguinis TaxID=2490941 RepID=A0A3S4GHQ6_9HYPH|nr:MULTISPECIES: tryptophan--tRNA ligase [Devosia]ODT48259.1 MAG: tryptophan--tRNA ligase [Pelagibacterium sp. SCN 63-126]ODU82956.1 MAG: tryptophan--tRNA ligase [Pelagibacterium sp. SCN 63-17]OJX42029.1 MAG: tryptophan--tRNA ligase [Devosia sp. 63-57]VDS03398.1 Tryptophan--tRNA ligase [Devosia equisanguinis]